MILYVHGFASGGASGTVMLLRQALYPYGIKVAAPDLPLLPSEAIGLLRTTVEQLRPRLIIGTSMGGFLAEMLRGYPRILVNPSFHTARLLTFRGTGRYPFSCKREDGSKDFKVDKAMIEDFRRMEKLSFQGITPTDKELVWGLFGDKDPTVHTQDDFTRHYGRGHFQVFDGEHRLNDKIVSRVVLPLIRQILQLD